MKPKILIQFDPDAHASTFDSIVAIDSGVDQLLQRANVTERDIEGLVHGAMFTRGVKDLCRTALFFGGSNVENTEALVAAAKKCFFGPMRVSIMSDPNGSNTTAAAAVLSAEKHGSLSEKKIVILAGTGPVGQRIAKIIASAASVVSASIFVCSRKLEKATSVVDDLSSSMDVPTGIELQPAQAGSVDEAAELTRDADVVFAAGAAGICLMDDRWQQNDRQQILIDINAVPPSGIAGVEVMDTGEQRGNSVCYGAIGVGGLKMKIHKLALQKLFETNDLVLDTETIYQLGTSLA
ncbi:MAG: methylene-tetrahydromethanopterin dehydrogenase N-terminal domain-containing protein [Planctomycetota bacterium]